VSSRISTALVAVGAAALCAASTASAATINGAGATFAAPLWQTLGSDFGKSTGNTVNYQSVGSGAGKAQLIAKTINYAGSDNILNPSEQERATASAGPQQHLPVALGAIAMVYKVPGLKSHLKLDGPTIARIFLGQVRKWNDAAIAKQNKGVKLPDAAIQTVHRSDSSGTTFGFTEFLGGWSGAWVQGPGINQAPKWPGGIGGRGNEGVAAGVAQTPNSIGYVELAYAIQNKFKVAAVKNRAGNYIVPSLKSSSAAGVGIKVPPSLRVNVVNSSNRDAYPITSQTFGVVYKDLCKGGSTPEQAKTVVEFLNYVAGKTGQVSVEKLSYAPLPGGLQKKVLAAIGTLTCNGSKP